MDSAEEIKLTYKFEWEKKVTVPGSSDWSSQGKRNRELGLRQDQNLSSVYHIRNNIWLNWLMNNSSQEITYIWASWLN
jgi:hypothetical protein